MSSQEQGAYFKGLLANVDSSILQVNFNHGFKIESFSMEEAVALLSQLEGTPGMLDGMSFVQRYFSVYNCFNFSEQRMYVISKSFENTFNQDPSTFFSERTKFDNALVRGYLEPLFRSMRLFKEGDIRMPARFYYRDRIPGRMHIGSELYVSREPYHLESDEISILDSFTGSIELPFKRDFLHLAFENFELSYGIPDMQLAFLVLMIGLETLLNPSQYEVRHRISRNTAVLLGENRANSEEIFTEVKKLYDKRSEIVHSGKRSIVVRGDFLKLRDYLRKAIIKINRIEMEKNEITDLLDSHGFGEEIKTS